LEGHVGVQLLNRTTRSVSPTPVGERIAAWFGIRLFPTIDLKEDNMFGISPLGWVHTIGSLPAVPAAIYMLARHGRIVPRSKAGAIYFATMMIGAASVFLIGHQSVSYGFGILTIIFLLAGYSAYRLPIPKSASNYLETISLSITVFLLMTPTVSETLRRVPDGHPFVTDIKSPVLIGAQGVLLLALVLGVVAQIVVLRRRASGN
jgi:hypothetical protein